MATLAAIEMLVLAATCFAILSSISTALLIPSLLRRMANWSPQSRHVGVFALCVAPAIMTGMLVAAAISPSVVALFVPSFDHCMVHNDGHAHLCFVHLPEHGAHVLVLVAWVVCFSILLVKVLGVVTRVLRAMRLLHVLGASGQRREDLGVTVLEVDAQLCVAAGLVHPHILISKHLVETLTPRDRDIVLTHERAHVRRRDTLARFVAALASVLHLPNVRRKLLQHLDIAAEQACDEEAARVVGDRLAVAEAILAVERALQGQPSRSFAPAALAFGQCAVAQRVEALLDAPRNQGSLRAFSVVALGSVMILVALAEQFHHATESLLSFLVH